MVVWSSWPFYYIEMSLEKKYIVGAAVHWHSGRNFLDFCLFVQKGFYADISWDKNETMNIKSIL